MEVADSVLRRGSTSGPLLRSGAPSLMGAPPLGAPPLGAPPLGAPLTRKTERRAAWGPPAYSDTALECIYSRLSSSEESQGGGPPGDCWGAPSRSYPFLPPPTGAPQGGPHTLQQTGYQEERRQIQKQRNSLDLLLASPVRGEEIRPSAAAAAAAAVAAQQQQQQQQQQLQQQQQQQQQQEPEEKNETAQQLRQQLQQLRAEGHRRAARLRRERQQLQQQLAEVRQQQQVWLLRQRTSSSSSSSNTSSSVNSSNSSSNSLSSNSNSSSSNSSSSSSSQESIGRPLLPASIEGGPGGPGGPPFPLSLRVWCCCMYTI
ncbi:uncharacterized protein EMH_0016640 [Eimeria mitis]|uniref:Uncharacterized protein n=1 Tax=Eimeria mitis TaxID=44415 RepID=U6K9T5_9EIME|nr:uncharacterized protein EMH_0016640 [Eimeria mitis]CDJ33571.1 hypothetical protein, conserved [Eimeria mitis]